MKICQAHWDKLRKAIDERGMGHLGAKNSQDAVRAMVTDLEGRGAENDFDPLMGCNNMIWSKGLDVVGLSLMNPMPDGSEQCPICEAMKSYESWWIDGPADAMLKEAKEKGLVQG